MKIRRDSDKLSLLGFYSLDKPTKSHQKCKTFNLIWLLKALWKYWQQSWFELLFSLLLSCLTPSVFSSHRHFHQNVKACDRSNIQNPPPPAIAWYLLLFELRKLMKTNQAGNNFFTLFGSSCVTVFQQRTTFNLFWKRKWMGI